MNIKTFWTNSIWYLILMFISVVLLSYTLYKSKSKRRHLGFFVSILGLTFIVETVIFLQQLPCNFKGDKRMTQIIDQISCFNPMGNDYAPNAS